MRQITYKYNIGDVIRFKEKFNKTTTSCLKKFASRAAKVTERRDYNGPCYRLEGIEGFFTERCFTGIVEVSMDTRTATNKVLELAEEGAIAWQDLALMALKFMSEDSVAEMLRVNEVFIEDEEE